MLLYVKYQKDLKKNDYDLIFSYDFVVSKEKKSFMFEAIKNLRLFQQDIL